MTKKILVLPDVPISLTLPKREEPYESEYLFLFYTYLLPEGE